jgi:hypothetical protein
LARIWSGFHYSFDITAGETLGQSVGDYVVEHFSLPVGRPAAGRSSPSTHRAAVVPDRSMASLVGGPADAGFRVYGAVDGLGDRDQLATPSLDGSPTLGDWARVSEIASGSQPEVENASDIGALGGHVGRRHLPGSGKSLDHGLRSLVAGEGIEDFSVGGLPEF